MNHPQHSLNSGYTGADEDRRDNGKACASLCDLRAQSERDAKRHSRQGVPEVVDQVGEQRDAAARHKNDRLGNSG